MNSTQKPTPWHKEPTMQLVAGVLLSTLASGVVMLSLALSGDDPLVVSDQQYQQIRDEFRLTEPRRADDN